MGGSAPRIDRKHKKGTLSLQTNDGNISIAAEKLINSLSFTHIAELIEIEEPLKRSFYELECVKGQWSVRELQRQINTLYFERSGLSGNSAHILADQFARKN